MTEVASAAPAVAMPLVVEEEIRDTPATAAASVVDVLKAAAAKEEAQRLEELQERVRPSEGAIPAVPVADAEDVKDAVSDAIIVDPDVVCTDLVILPASPFEQDGSNAAVPLVDAAPSDPQAAEETSIPASTSEVEVQAAHIESEATDSGEKDVETGAGPEVGLSDSKAEDPVAESAEENKEVIEPAVDAQTTPSVQTETETVPADAVTPSHHQPDSEVQIEAAKTEDAEVPEIAEEEEVKADEPAVGEVGGPAEETLAIKEEAPAIEEAPSAVEAPATVEEPTEEPPSVPAPVETEETPAATEAPALEETEEEPSSVPAPLAEEEAKPVDEEPPAVEDPVVAADVTEESPAQVDVSEVEAAPEEPVESEAQPQEAVAEDAEEPQVETVEPVSEVPTKETDETPEAEKVEEPAEVTQPAEAEEEAPAAEEPEAEKVETVIEAETAPEPASEDVAPPEEPAEAAPAPVPTVEDAKPEIDVGTDTDAAAAQKAYELAHAHAIDEVAFDTPTDEEIKEVVSSEAREEAQDPAPTADTEAPVEEVKEEEPPAAAETEEEPGAPSYTETKAEEPEAAAEPETAATTAEEAVEAPAPEPTNSAYEDKPEETDIAAPPEVQEEVVEDPAPSAEAPSAEEPVAEPDLETSDVAAPEQPSEAPEAVDENVAVAEEPVVTAKTEEPEVPPAPEVPAEVPPAEPASANTEVPKAEEQLEVAESEPIVAKEAADEPAPPAAEPEDGPEEKETVVSPAVEEHAEADAPPVEAVAAEEPTAPAEVVEDEEPSVDAPEEAEPTEKVEEVAEPVAEAPVEPAAEPAAEDVTEPEEPDSTAAAAGALADEQKPTEEAAPAHVDVETAVPEVSSDETASVDDAGRSEDKLEATETDAPVPDVIPAEEPAEVEVEEPGATPEAEGVAEPAATPATDGTAALARAASSEKLAANIDQIDELLQEESAEEEVKEADSTIPDVPTASVEEPVKDDEPAIALEPAETILELAASVEEDIPVVEEDENVKEGAALALESAEEDLAATEEPSSIISETVEEVEEEQAEEVPDVLVETPTPMSETLSFDASSEEDEEDDIPVELRLAKAVGIPPEEVAKLPALSLTMPPTTEVVTEEEAITPTETQEDEAKEEALSIGSQEHETPTQSVLLERPEDHEEEAAAPPEELAVDANVTEAPERPRSPWTPSYSVTNQGTSPVHPEEAELPKEEPVEEKPTEVTPEVVADVEEAVAEKAIVEEASAPEEVSQPPEVVDTQVLAAIPVAPEPEPAAETVETAADEIAAPETVLGGGPETEEAAVVPESNVELEVLTTAEAHQAQPSDETLIEEESEAPVKPVPATLVVDTSATEVPERPKSPWTPSYTVTKVGPGVPEPEELHLDADVPAESKVDTSEEEQQVEAKDEQTEGSAPEVPAVEASGPEPVPIVERPKSPYPPSYSVTQMGPGQVEETTPAGEPEEGASFMSNEPEAPLTPQSELRSVTPGFDSRSEVSEASHIPNPPDSPRTDPDVNSLSEAEVGVKTPLVTGTEEQEEQISPISTPLLSVKEVEDLGASEPLTEAVVSGIEDAQPRSLLIETEAEEVAQPSLTAQGTEETIIAADTAENIPSQANEADVSKPPAPELKIHPAPPVIVTNTLSTDSAYTQISDTFSPSQETGTNVTTPDVETIPIPKVHEFSDVESLGEEPTVQRSSDITPTGTLGKGKSLGIAHTLAMRSFPSAFAQPEEPSASEQPKQATDVESLEANDLLAPLDSRRRLESTASSLAFPGGWVSSPAKKERASLEVATGEFSRPAVEGGNPLSPVTTPPQAEPVPEQAQGKWRCVIM